MFFGNPDPPTRPMPPQAPLARPVTRIVHQRTAPRPSAAAETPPAPAPPPRGQGTRREMDVHRRWKEERASIVAALAKPTAHMSPAALRTVRQLNMGLYEADSSPFAFDPTSGPMSSYFASIPDVIAASAPPSTLKRDALAWRRWTEFCALVPTQSWRLDRNAHSGADAAGFDRESRLLCAFLVWCYDIIQPRSKSSKAAKPASAYQMVDGVRRVHRRGGIFMVSTKELTMMMNGLTAAYVAEHGSESLLPQRKNPIGPDLTRRLLSTPTGTVLGSKTLDWSDALFLNLGAMFALGESTGFRKAEVALPNDAPFDDRRLRRSSVLWQIDGVIYADPSPDLLRSLVRGRDKALIKPPRSKADQHGVIWGAHPIWVAFDDTDVANAAWWLQRLELAFPLRGGHRLHAPLFFTDGRTFAPMTHSTVDTYLGHLLRANVPADQMASYSFHSFRIGFACALLAANCPYDMIQALARWRSDKSIAIYARLNPDDYAAWVAKALRQHTTSTTTARLPFIIDADDAVATFQHAATHFKDAHATHETALDDDMDE